MDYSTYQQHQQQQEQGYDSSQNQAFDQSSQSYFGYSQQYAYYSNQDQGNSYAHQQYQQESTSIHPPGVPLPPEQAQIQNQQFSNQDSRAALGGPMNPEAAAVAIAALSQLTQFAGNPPIDILPCSLQIGQSRYRGGGGRGSRPFRRGGRGHFNPRGRGPYRGGGHGHGGGRHLPSHSSEFVPAAAAGGTSVAQPSPLVSVPIPAQVPAAPLHLPPCKLWCEICKVECNSAEIMEQHKNGKRHKKNLQVHEELQRRKAINGQQSSQIPSSQLNLTTQAEKALELNTEGCPAENMISGATGDNPKNELDLQNNTGQTSEVPANDPEENSRDGLASRGRGSKRKKMRGGRGGKYMRNNDGSRKPVEPPKPKQALSFICELCNIICESQVVYDSHLTGKKHQSNLKRVHGHQAMSQEPGPQAVPPTNTSAMSNSIDINALANSINSQVQQGVNDPQVLLAQLLMTVLSQAQVSTAAAPIGSVASQLSALIPGAGSSYGLPLQNVPQTQALESAAHGGNEDPTGKEKDRVLSDPPLAADPQTAGGSSETEDKVASENPSAANEQGASEGNGPTS